MVPGERGRRGFSGVEGTPTSRNMGSLDLGASKNHCMVAVLT